MTRNAPAAPRRLPRLLAVALWLVAAVAAGAVTWWAVAATGGQGAGGDTVLSQDEVAAELARATESASAPTAAPPESPTTTPTPTVTPTQEPGGPTTPPGTAPPATAPVARTWDVPGGQVSAQCDGAAAVLLYATPTDGWTVEVKSSGPEHVEVELTQGESETKVRATCVDGVPTQVVESDDD